MPEVIFPGPEGRLEGRYHPQKDRDAPIAIVLHPHPQFGGTMNNKVVYNLHYAFYNMGFTVLRFNFRGVGRSQGEYDQGIGELSDAASALDYLQSMNNNSKHCWVAGFSFGAWIGMQLLMRRTEITGFISVSPPANMYDFSFLAPCPSSGMIINGAADRIAPTSATVELVDKLREQRGSTVTHNEMEGAGHFFEEAEGGLVRTVNQKALGMHQELITLAELVQTLGCRDSPQTPRKDSNRQGAPHQRHNCKAWRS